LTFEFSFVARSTEAALNRVLLLQRQDAAGAARSVPDEVFSLVEAYLRAIDHDGLVSVHAVGAHPEASPLGSTLLVEVRPMTHFEFVEG